MQNYKTTVAGMLSAIGAYLIQQPDPLQHKIGSLLAMLGPFLLGYHAQDAAPPSPPAGGAPFRPVLMLGLLLFTLAGAGCSITKIVSTPAQVTITETGWGLHVKACSTTTGTPDVLLGYGRSTIVLTPASTNGVPVSLPPSQQSFTTQSGLNPFGSNLDDSQSTGFMAVYDLTNILATAIVPK